MTTELLMLFVSDRMNVVEKRNNIFFKFLRYIGIGREKFKYNLFLLNKIKRLGEYFIESENDVIKRKNLSSLLEKVEKLLKTFKKEVPYDYAKRNDGRKNQLDTSR